MARIQSTINKVKKALTSKGQMTLINTEQFYSDEGKPITKYIIHYGHPYDRKDKKGNIIVENDIYDTVYGKVNLLKALIEILKAGDTSE